jgi:hypothetical protein
MKNPQHMIYWKLFSHREKRGTQENGSCVRGYFTAHLVPLTLTKKSCL